MSSLKSTTRPTRLLCGFLMCTEHGSADVMSVDISQGAIGVMAASIQRNCISA